jgi:hypothetical protein
MAGRPQLLAVPIEVIRRLFNEGKYWNRVQSGELTEKLLHDGHPSPPRSAEPLCTRSQVIAYLDAKGHRVAIVHQYLRTDGRLGASGKPDPKKLLHQGVLYTVR